MVSHPAIPRSKDWKPFALVRAVEGKRITLVRALDEGWDPTKADGLVPDSKHLFNFDVKVGSRTLLVLDPYGNESLPEDLMKHLQLPRIGVETIGIWRDDGQIVQVGFAKEKREYVLFYSSLTPAIRASSQVEIVGGAHLPSFRFPKELLPRLDELKSAKRPYDFTLFDFGWARLHNRFIGFDDLEEYLVVKFDLHNDEFLEVSSDGYRMVTRWKR